MAAYQNATVAKELSSVVQCIKYLLFVMNFLFFAIGCAGVALGIWFLLEKNYMSIIIDSDLMTASSWMIIIGCGTIALVSFFGCLGAIGQMKTLLLLYFVVVSIVFLGLITGGILALVLRSEIKEEVKAVMRESLEDHYGIDLDNNYNRAVTDAWDMAQEKLYCCAVEDQSWELYKGSKWYKSQLGDEERMINVVPPACCVRDIDDRYIDITHCQRFILGPPQKKTSRTNTVLFYTGCYNAGRDFIYEYTGYIAAIGLGVGLLMIVGIAFAIILYVKLPY